jgi:mannose-1-phosphate guanylyltransferase
MIHAVIMAGGKGTRFWPLSRARKAKQYLKIISNESFLQATIKRLDGLVSAENVWIVSNREQQVFVEKNKGTVPSNQILYEPQGKNTAPCIGWVAQEIVKKDPEAIMIVVPSDQYIEPNTQFLRNLEEGIKFVEKTNSLVTIGITPTSPHTGYGYIQAQDKSAAISKVTAFKEKPNFSLAQSYVEAGNYYWNSGIFIWKAEKIITLIEKYMPALYKELQSLSKDPENLNKYYASMPSVSIDYGIMEHAVRETYVIKSTFNWSDIGNWTSLENFWPKDKDGNGFKAHLMALESKNNLIYSEKRLVGLIDINDLIIIDSEDALLILPKKSDQKIKDLYNILPDEYR